jgi:hypothetical protein
MGTGAWTGRTLGAVAALPLAAGVAQWQSPSLPSWLCGFDPRHPLSGRDALLVRGFRVVPGTCRERFEIMASRPLALARSRSGSGLRLPSSTRPNSGNVTIEQGRVQLSCTRSEVQAVVEPLLGEDSEGRTTPLGVNPATAPNVRFVTRQPLPGRRFCQPVGTPGYRAGLPWLHGLSPLCHTETAFKYREPDRAGRRSTPNDGS